MVEGNNGIWYRIEFDMNGQHFVCSINSSSGDAFPNFADPAAVVMEI
jgi:hypothetical protein